MQSSRVIQCVGQWVGSPKLEDRKTAAGARCLVFSCHFFSFIFHFVRCVVLWWFPVYRIGLRKRIPNCRSSKLAAGGFN
jgi:hypothetical protein